MDDTFPGQAESHMTLIWGTFVQQMAEEGEGLGRIRLKDLARMMEAGLNGLYSAGDTGTDLMVFLEILAPAVYVMKAEALTGGDFSEALERMKAAAGAGWTAVKDTAGIQEEAKKCLELLRTMASGIQDNLQDGSGP